MPLLQYLVPYGVASYPIEESYVKILVGSDNCAQPLSSFVIKPLNLQTVQNYKLTQFGVEIRVLELSYALLR